jgi:phosphatidate cytidylyltransferase
MNIFSGAKDRVITGFALLAAVLLIGIINNFFVMYVVFGVIYLLAFKEALKLFEIQNTSLSFYAVALWIIAGIYPYGDDIFV